MFSRRWIVALVCMSLSIWACNDKPNEKEYKKVPEPKAAAKTKAQKPKVVRIPANPVNKPPGKEDNPNELRVEHRDGGIFIVNSAQKGKIVHSDGGVVLVLEETPSKEQPASEPDPIVPPKTTPTKAEPNAEMAEKIRDYFFVMDNFQVGPVGVKPRKFAEKLLANMAKNNNEDLDNLVSGMDDIRTKMKAVQPPKPCEDYHSLSIELLDSSKSMMEELANAVKSNNKDRLNALIAKATLLKARTKKLEKLRATIEKRFNISDSH